MEDRDARALARRWVVAAALACGTLAATAAIAQQPSAGVDPKAWGDVVAAARKEGRVTYYTVTPPGPVGRVIAGFKKAYPGIEVEVLNQSSGELFARIRQELTAGIDGADLWTTTDVVALKDMARDGKLSPPAGPALQAWPAKYLEQQSVVIAGLEPRIIAFNKSLLKDPPQTYRDALKPEFKGKIGTTDASAKAFVAFYDWLEKTQDPEYLPKLKAQNPKLYVGALAQAQALASGEVAINLFQVPSALTELIQQGAPIGYVVPNPNLGIAYGTAILASSRRKNAALVLLDYIMSADGQTAWHGRGESASALPGVAGAVSPDSIVIWDPTAYPTDVEQRFRTRFVQTFR